MVEIQRLSFVGEADGFGFWENGFADGLGCDKGKDENGAGEGDRRCRWQIQVVP